DGAPWVSRERALPERGGSRQRRDITTHRGHGVSGARSRRHLGAGAGPGHHEQRHVRWGGGWLDSLRDHRGWSRGEARRPRGARRGRDGARGSTCVKGAPLAPKVSVSLEPGDVLRVETPGGGGWGVGEPERGDKR